MSNLVVKIFRNFEPVLKPGVCPKHVYLIDRGEINVIDRTGMFVLARLPVGSFFGEYQVVHAVASAFIYESGAVHDETDNQGHKKTGHWLYSIESKKFVKILSKYPSFLQRVRVRSSMRRAHLMLIQSELYESYIERLTKKDELYGAIEAELEDVDVHTPLSKSYLYSHFDFLPFQLQDLLKERAEYKERDYYKEKTHNLMTEDFVLRFP